MTRRKDRKWDILCLKFLEKPNYVQKSVYHLAEQIGSKTLSWQETASICAWTGLHWAEQYLRSFFLRNITCLLCWFTPLPPCLLSMRNTTWHENNVEVLLTGRVTGRPQKKRKWRSVWGEEKGGWRCCFQNGYLLEAIFSLRSNADGSSVCTDCTSSTLCIWRAGRPFLSSL